MRHFILAAVAAVVGLGTATAGDAKPDGKALTNDELVTMLENLGYDILKRPADTDVIKRVTIKVSRAGFPLDIPMQVNLTKDGSTLYFFVNLADLTGEELTNAAALLKLLELNDDGGKNQFRVNAKSKQLWLARFTANVGMTPAALKRHVEDMAAHIADTRDHWDAKKWKTATATAKQ